MGERCKVIDLGVAKITRCEPWTPGRTVGDVAKEAGKDIMEFGDKVTGGNISGRNPDKLDILDYGYGGKGSFNLIPENKKHGSVTPINQDTISDPSKAEIDSDSAQLPDSGPIQTPSGQKQEMYYAGLEKFGYVQPEYDDDGALVKEGYWQDPTEISGTGEAILAGNEAARIKGIGQIRPAQQGQYAQMADMMKMSGADRGALTRMSGDASERESLERQGMTGYYGDIAHKVRAGDLMEQKAAQNAAATGFGMEVPWKDQVFDEGVRQFNADLDYKNRIGTAQARAQEQGANSGFWSSLLGGLGMVGGYMYGGPMGGAMGGALGSSLGGYGANQFGPKDIYQPLNAPTGGYREGYSLGY